ncbi:MAG: GNAT family N-acetyltransferase [Alphaproteobacteria bacterium]|nr:GNAT family N-acetyltransferase [Alphaproteobacteria bacterium]
MDTEPTDTDLAPLAMRVRLAGPRDAQVIADLLGSTDDLFARPELAVLVAQGDEGVLGVAVLRARPPARATELDRLVVRAEVRGRRVGRRLLAAAVEWSRQRRALQLEVPVLAADADARRFLKGFGFAATSDRLVLAA